MKVKVIDHNLYTSQVKHNKTTQINFVIFCVNRTKVDCVLLFLKSKGSKICNRHQFGHFTIGIIEKVKE